MTAESKAPKRFSGSLRSRLIIVILLVSLVPLAGVTAYNYISARDIITDQVEDTLTTATQLKVSEVNAWLSDFDNRTQTMTSRLVVTGDGTEENALGIPVFAANYTTPGNSAYLGAQEEAFNRLTPFVGDDGSVVDVLMTTVDGTVIYSQFGLTELGTDIGDRNWLDVPVGDIINDPLYDTTVLTMSQPVFGTGTDTQIGNLIMVLDGDALSAILTDRSELAGSSSYETYLVNGNNLMITDSRFMEGAILQQVIDTDGLLRSRSLQPGEIQAFGVYNDYRDVPVIGVASYFENLDWTLLTEINQSEALAPTTELLQTDMLVFGGVMILVILLALQFATQISRPLLEVANTARAFTQGDYSQRMKVTGGETGQVAEAFNQMAERLQTTLSDLEARIAARTNDLETSAEIASAANQVRETGDLLSLTVNLIRDRFNLYYVQVYLLDLTGEWAVLKDGTGYVGRKLISRNHRLPVDGQSIVASAIQTNKPTVVQDTANDPNFLPNELLPETKSEVAIPLRLQGEVIGVLDIQHNEANFLDDSTLRLFQSMADQLAVIFENVNLLQSTERRAAELETVATVSATASTILDIDEMLNEVVTLTRDNFHLYHAHIYLLDDEGDNLKLAAGAGEPGRIMVERGHSIPLNREHSLVATAAREQRGVIVNDVTADPDFLPNELLPETKSEMAIPIVVGENVIGVLDVQSTEFDRFDNEDVRVKTTLASQVGVAVENARAFERVQEARQEVERVFSTSIDMLGSANFQGYFTSLNPAWSKTLGWTEAELMAKPFIEFVHPDDIEMTNREAAKIFGGDDTVSFENRYQHKDGTYRWVAWNSAADVENKLVHFVARDVTAAKEATLEMERQASIINTSDDFISLTDLEGNVVYLNPGGARMIGLGDDYNIDGYVIPDFHPPEVAQRVLEEGIPQVYATGSWRGETELLHKDGHRIPVDQTIFVVRDELGNPRNLGTIINDITERKRQQEFNARLAEASTQLSQAQDEDEILAAVASIAQPYGMSIANLNYLDMDADGNPEYVNVMAARSGDGEPLPLTVFPATRMHRDEFPLLKNIVDETANQVLFIENVETDPIIDEMTREFMRSSQISAGVSVSLKQGDRWLGSLGLNWDKPIDMPDEFRQLLQAIMPTLSSVVASRRAYLDAEVAREQTNKLYEISAAINEADTFQDIVDAVYEHIDKTDLLSISLTIFDTEDYATAKAARVVGGRRPTGISPLVGTSMSMEQFPFLKTVDPSRVNYIDDIANDTTLDEGSRAAFQSMGVQAQSYIPINIDDKWAASLTIVRNAPYHHNAMMLELLHSLGSQLATIIARFNLTTETQKRANEMEVVAQVSSEASTVLDVNELLWDVSNLTKERFALYHAHIYLLNEAGDTLVLTAGAGEAGQTMVAEHRTIPFDAEQSLVATAARQRTGVIVNDVTADPNFLPHPMLPDTKSEMAIPMIVGDTLVGVLDVQANVTDRFTNEDVRVQTTLAGQIAVAVQNARSYQQSLKQSEELAIVSEVSAKISTILDPEELITEVAEITARSFDLYHLHMYLVDDSGDNLLLVAGTGEAPCQHVGKDYRLNIQTDETPVTIAARTRKGQIDNNVSQEHNLEFNPFLPETRSQIAIPLLVGGKLFGVLEAHTNVRDGFDEDDIRIKTILAEQIAISLQNAQSFQETQTSEALMSNMINSIPDLIFYKDLEGKYTGANDSFAEFVDRPLDKIVGYTDYDLFGQEIADFFREQDSLMMQQGESRQNEEWVKYPDGRDVLLDTLKTPIFGPDGEIIGMLGISRDVTEGKAQQAALDEQRRLLDAIVNNIPSGIFVVEAPSATPIFSNRRAEELLGRGISPDANEEHLAEVYEAYKAGTDELYPAEEQPVVRGLYGEVSRIDDMEVRRPDGSAILLEISGVPIKDDEDNIVASVVSFEDITERQAQQEEIQRRAVELQTVAEVSAQATSTLDVNVLLKNVSDLTKERFDLYHAHIYLLDDAGENLVLAAGAGDAGDKMVKKGHAIPVDREHSLVASAARERDGIIANDVTEAEDFMANELLPDTRSEMAIPMIVGDTLVGVLDVQSTRIGRFTDEDVRIKRSLSDQVAVAVQNARAFERIEAAQRATEDMRSAIDASAIVAFTDVTGKITYVNDRFCEISKYKREELIGQDHRIINSGHHSKEFIRDLWVTIANGNVWRGEIKNRAKDDSYYWVDTTIIPFLNERGKPYQYVAIRYDITERKAQQAEIFKRANEVEMVAAIGAEVVSEQNVSELLWTVSNLTKENFNRYHAHIYMMDDDGQNLTLVAGAGEVGRQLVEQGHSIPLDKEDSVVARAARKQVGVVIGDTHEDEGFLPNPLLPETRSELAVPIILNDEVIGVLDVQDSHPNAFSDAEVQSKMILANQIAAAIQNAQAFERVEEARQEVQRVFSTSIDMLGSANNQGYFVSLNPAWSKTLGWTDKELMAKPFIEFVHPDDIEMTNREAAKIFGGQDTVTFENRYLHKDGTYRWVSWNTAADTENSLVHFVARDVTEDKATQHMIETSRERAETLAAINALLSQANEEQEILTAVAPIAERYNVAMSTLTYYVGENDPLDVAEVVAVRSGDGQEVPLSFLPSTTLVRDGFPIIDYLAERADQVTVVNADDDFLTEDVREYMQGGGIATTILIPMMKGREWLGILSFAWMENTTIPDDLLDLAEAIRTTASSVVASRRAYLTAEKERRENEKRAAELETVARVSTATTTILEVDELLHSVVTLTRDSFALYHAHIYLLNEDGDKLLLAAGAGEPGRIMEDREHFIPMRNDNSLVVQAAKSGTGVIVNDVTANEHFLPNPLLPDTQSEMAIPMKVGGRVIGVLDVQSEQIDRFTNEDMRIKTTLADQISVAVQNANLFSAVEKQAELERETAERLREVDRLKSQFLANMSHELRTPLNSIIGYSEVLLDGVDGDLTEDAEEDVEAIHNSGKHLLSIINEILDLAKIEAGEMQLDRKEVDVVEFAAEIIRTGQVLVKDRPVELLLVQEDDLPQVMADPIRLRQVIWNLMSNAVKFTEEGSVSVILDRADDDFVRVTVKDTGVGMTEEGLNLIFERFSQVDGSSTRRAGGTGLGLTITKQLIEMHGGEIHVTSTMGEGSTFWFTLPVNVPETV